MTEVKGTKSQTDIVSKTSLNIKQNKKRRGNPDWKKGMESPNPSGAGLYKVQLGKLFSDAFLKDKEENKEDLFELAFRQARKDTRVLTALLNKFVPDLLKGEGFGDNKTIVYITRDTKASNSNRIQIHTASKSTND